MKKLINDLKHLVNPVNPVKNMKKRNEPKLSSLATCLSINYQLSTIDYEL